MPRTRAQRRLIAWIATFAVLAAALAPALSQAMSAWGGAGVRWVEICTTSGTHWIPVAAEDAPDGDTTPGMQASHCPYCASHAGSLGLPPASVTFQFAADSQPLEPALFLAAPRPLFVWAASHPRAPPAA